MKSVLLPSGIAGSTAKTVRVFSTHKGRYVMAEQFAKAWEGFAAGDWQTKLTFVILFKRTTHRTKATNLS